MKKVHNDWNHFRFFPFLAIGDVMKASATSKILFACLTAATLCCLGWVRPAWSAECIDPTVNPSTTGGDYCGNDLTISGTTPVTMYGKHYNIGIFTVEDGATVHVPNEANGGGLLEIHATDIHIEGLIDANYAGSVGGAGGGVPDSASDAMGPGKAGEDGQGLAGGMGGTSGASGVRLPEGEIPNGAVIDKYYSGGGGAGGGSGGGNATPGCGGGYGEKSETIPVSPYYYNQGGDGGDEAPALEPYSDENVGVHIGSGGGGGGGGGAGAWAPGYKNNQEEAEGMDFGNMLEYVFNGDTNGLGRVFMRIHGEDAQNILYPNHLDPSETDAFAYWGTLWDWDQYEGLNRDGSGSAGGTGGGAVVLVAEDELFVQGNGRIQARGADGGAAGEGYAPINVEGKCINSARCLWSDTNFIYGYRGTKEADYCYGGYKCYPCLFCWCGEYCKNRIQLYKFWMGSGSGGGAGGGSGGGISLFGKTVTIEKRDDNYWRFDVLGGAGGKGWGGNSGYSNHGDPYGKWGDTDRHNGGYGGYGRVKINYQDGGGFYCTTAGSATCTSADDVNEMIRSDSSTDRCGSPKRLELTPGSIDDGITGTVKIGAREMGSNIPLAIEYEFNGYPFTTATSPVGDEYTVHTWPKGTTQSVFINATKLVQEDQNEPGQFYQFVHWTHPQLGITETGGTDLLHDDSPSTDEFFSYWENVNGWRWTGAEDDLWENPNNWTEDGSETTTYPGEHGNDDKNIYIDPSKVSAPYNWPHITSNRPAGRNLSIMSGGKLYFSNNNTELFLSNLLNIQGEIIGPTTAASDADRAKLTVMGDIVFPSTSGGIAGSIKAEHMDIFLYGDLTMDTNSLIRQNPSNSSDSAQKADGRFILVGDSPTHFDLPTFKAVEAGGEPTSSRLVFAGSIQEHGLVKIKDNATGDEDIYEFVANVGDAAAGNIEVLMGADETDARINLYAAMTGGDSTVVLKYINSTASYIKVYSSNSEGEVIPGGRDVTLTTESLDNIYWSQSSLKSDFETVWGNADAGFLVRTLIVAKNLVYSSGSEIDWDAMKQRAFTVNDDFGKSYSQSDDPDAFGVDPGSPNVGTCTIPDGSDTAICSVALMDPTSIHTLIIKRGVMMLEGHNLYISDRLEIGSNQDGLTGNEGRLILGSPGKATFTLLGDDDGLALLEDSWVKMTKSAENYEQYFFKGTLPVDPPADARTHYVQIGATVAATIQNLVNTINAETGYDIRAEISNNGDNKLDLYNADSPGGALVDGTQYLLLEHLSGLDAKWSHENFNQTGSDGDGVEIRLLGWHRRENFTDHEGGALMFKLAKNAEFDLGKGSLYIEPLQEAYGFEMPKWATGAAGAGYVPVNEDDVAIQIYGYLKLGSGSRIFADNGMDDSGISMKLFDTSYVQGLETTIQLDSSLINDSGMYSDRVNLTLVNCNLTLGIGDTSLLATDTWCDNRDGCIEEPFAFESHTAFNFDTTTWITVYASVFLDTEAILTELSGIGSSTDLWYEKLGAGASWRFSWVILDSSAPAPTDENAIGSIRLFGSLPVGDAVVETERFIINPPLASWSDDEEKLYAGLFLLGDSFSVQSYLYRVGDPDASPDPIEPLYRQSTFVMKPGSWFRPGNESRLEFTGARVEIEGESNNPAHLEVAWDEDATGGPWYYDHYWQFSARKSYLTIDPFPNLLENPPETFGEDDVGLASTYLKVKYAEFGNLKANGISLTENTLLEKGAAFDNCHIFNSDLGTMLNVLSANMVETDPAKQWPASLSWDIDSYAFIEMADVAFDSPPLDESLVTEDEKLLALVALYENGLKNAQRGSDGYLRFSYTGKTNHPGFCDDGNPVLAGNFSGERFDNDVDKRVFWPISAPILNFYTKTEEYARLNSETGAVTWQMTDMDALYDTEHEEYLSYRVREVVKYPYTGPDDTTYVTLDTPWLSKPGEDTYPPADVDMWLSGDDWPSVKTYLFESGYYGFEAQARMEYPDFDGVIDPLETEFRGPCKWLDTDPTPASSTFVPIRKGPDSPTPLEATAKYDYDPAWSHMQVVWTGHDPTTVDRDYGVFRADIDSDNSEPFNGRYQPVGGFFDDFSDMNFTQNPAWSLTGDATSLQYWSASNQYLLFNTEGAGYLGDHPVAYPNLTQSRSSCDDMFDCPDGYWCPSVTHRCVPTDYEPGLMEKCSPDDWYDCQQAFECKNINGVKRCLTDNYMFSFGFMREGNDDDGGIQIVFSWFGRQLVWELHQEHPDNSGTFENRLYGVKKFDIPNYFHVENRQRTDSDEWGAIPTNQWMTAKIRVAGDSAYGYVDDKLFWRAENALACVGGTCSSTSECIATVGSGYVCDNGACVGHGKCSTDNFTCTETGYNCEPQIFDKAWADNNQKAVLTWFTSTGYADTYPIGIAVDEAVVRIDNVEFIPFSDDQVVPGSSTDLRYYYDDVVAVDQTPPNAPSFSYDRMAPYIGGWDGNSLAVGFEWDNNGDVGSDYYYYIVGYDYSGNESNLLSNMGFEKGNVDDYNNGAEHDLLLIDHNCFSGQYCAKADINSGGDFGRYLTGAMSFADSTNPLLLLSRYYRVPVSGANWVNPARMTVNYTTGTAKTLEQETMVYTTGDQWDRLWTGLEIDPAKTVSSVEIVTWAESGTALEMSLDDNKLFKAIKGSVISDMEYGYFETLARLQNDDACRDDWSFGDKVAAQPDLESDPMFEYFWGVEDLEPNTGVASRIRSCDARSNCSDWVGRVPCSDPLDCHASASEICKNFGGGDLFCEYRSIETTESLCNPDCAVIPSDCVECAVEAQENGCFDGGTTFPSYPGCSADDFCANCAPECQSASLNCATCPKDCVFTNQDTQECIPGITAFSYSLTPPTPTLVQVSGENPGLRVTFEGVPSWPGGKENSIDTLYAVQVWELNEKIDDCNNPPASVGDPTLLYIHNPNQSNSSIDTACNTGNDEECWNLDRVWALTGDTIDDRKYYCMRVQSRNEEGAIGVSPHCLLFWDYCSSSSECPDGFTCDSSLGQCVGKEPCERDYTMGYDSCGSGFSCELLPSWSPWSNVSRTNAAPGMKPGGTLKVATGTAVTSDLDARVNYPVLRTNGSNGQTATEKGDRQSVTFSLVDANGAEDITKVQIRIGTDIDCIEDACSVENPRGWFVWERDPEPPTAGCSAPQNFHEAVSVDPNGCIETPQGGNELVELLTDECLVQESENILDLRFNWVLDESYGDVQDNKIYVWFKDSQGNKISWGIPENQHDDALTERFHVSTKPYEPGALEVDSLWTNWQQIGEKDNLYNQYVGESVFLPTALGMSDLNLKAENNIFDNGDHVEFKFYFAKLPPETWGYYENLAELDCRDFPTVHESDWVPAVKTYFGISCHSDSECATGATCNVTDTSSCIGGDSCYDNSVCVGTTGTCLDTSRCVGENVCVENSQCDTDNGYYCDTGINRCIGLGQCSKTNTDCPPAFFCEVSDDCSLSGYTCNLDTGHCEGFRQCSGLEPTCPENYNCIVEQSCTDNGYLCDGSLGKCVGVGKCSASDPSCPENYYCEVSEGGVCSGGCYENSDCPGNYNCSVEDTSTCINGPICEDRSTCVQEAASGVCAEDTDCETLYGTGYACDIVTSHCEGAGQCSVGNPTSCPSGYNCVTSEEQSHCIGNPDGLVCTKDGDCPEDYYCDSGSSRCRGDGECSIGDQTCPTGYHCELGADTSTCIGPSEVDGCKTDSDCESGFECVIELSRCLGQGMCSAEDTSCPTNFECEQNFEVRSCASAPGTCTTRSDCVTNYGEGYYCESDTLRCVGEGKCTAENPGACPAGTTCETSTCPDGYHCGQSECIAVNTCTVNDPYCGEDGYHCELDPYCVLNYMGCSSNSDCPNGYACISGGMCVQKFGCTTENPTCDFGGECVVLGACIGDEGCTDNSDCPNSSYYCNPKRCIGPNQCSHDENSCPDEYQCQVSDPGQCIATELTLVFSCIENTGTCTTDSNCIDSYGSGYACDSQERCVGMDKCSATSPSCPSGFTCTPPVSVDKNDLTGWTNDYEEKDGFYCYYARARDQHVYLPGEKRNTCLDENPPSPCGYCDTDDDCDHGEACKLVRESTKDGAQEIKQCLTKCELSRCIGESGASVCTTDLDCTSTVGAGYECVVDRSHCVGPGQCTVDDPTTCLTGFQCETQFSCVGGSCNDNGDCDTAGGYYCNTTTHKCIGDGKCSEASPDCSKSGYACEDTSVCMGPSEASSCSEDADCGSGYYCEIEYSHCEGAGQCSAHVPYTCPANFRCDLSVCSNDGEYDSICDPTEHVCVRPGTTTTGEIHQYQYTRWETDVSICNFSGTERPCQTHQVLGVDMTPPILNPDGLWVLDSLLPEWWYNAGTIQSQKDAWLAQHDTPEEEWIGTSKFFFYWEEAEDVHPVTDDQESASGFPATGDIYYYSLTPVYDFPEDEEADPILMPIPQPAYKQCTNSDDATQRLGAGTRLPYFDAINNDYFRKTSDDPQPDTECSVPRYGRHRFCVQARDAAGNFSNVICREFWVDRAATSFELPEAESDTHSHNLECEADQIDAGEGSGHANDYAHEPLFSLDLGSLAGVDEEGENPGPRAISFTVTDGAFGPEVGVPDKIPEDSSVEDNPHRQDVGDDESVTYIEYINENGDAQTPYKLCTETFCIDSNFRSNHHPLDSSYPWKFNYVYMTTSGQENGFWKEIRYYIKRGSTFDESGNVTQGDGELVNGTFYFTYRLQTQAGLWTPDAYTYKIQVCRCTKECDEERMMPISTMHMFEGGELVLDGSLFGASSTSDTQSIEVDPFWMDRTEVTNAQYASCVNEGVCPALGEDAAYDSATRKDYFFDPDYQSYPVLNVSWDGAQSYCKWVGRRLPSEIEWAWAARNSVSEGKYFDLSYATPNPLYKKDEGDTVHVEKHIGLKPASETSVLNMFSNVSEWTGDWYLSPEHRVQYGKNAPQSPEVCMATCFEQVDKAVNRIDAEMHPDDLATDDLNAFRDEEYGVCKATCQRKVVRGASFADEEMSLGWRSGVLPSDVDLTIGFRCAKTYVVEESNETDQAASESLMDYLNDTAKTTTVTPSQTQTVNITDGRLGLK